MTAPRHNVAVDIPTDDEQPSPWPEVKRHRVAVVSPLRTLVGFVLGVALLSGLTAFLVHHRSSVTVATSLALYLLLVVSITAVGGPFPGTVAAVVAPLLANWYLIPPYHTFRINHGDNLLELSVFVSTATIVSAYVSIAARRASEAEQARKETYELALEQRRLRKIALEAEMLTKADELRTAMLRAVSHDLRTPLAGIKASVSSLRQPDVEWSEDDRDDFLRSIEGETDRLTDIVTNLLDLSRIEAGVLRPVMQVLSPEDVVSRTLRSLPDDSANVVVSVPEETPDILSDHALLERVLVNLVQNAVKWSPSGGEITVRCESEGSSVRFVVVDHGPGIPTEKRELVLQPFHRLDDTRSGGGIGLGLAIADRLVAALGGKLSLSETPGGGLSVSVELPSAKGATV